MGHLKFHASAAAFHIFLNKTAVCIYSKYLSLLATHDRGSGILAHLILDASVVSETAHKH